MYQSLETWAKKKLRMIMAMKLATKLSVQARPKILQYLQQDASVSSSFEQSRKQLADLVAWIDQMEKVVKTPAAGANARPQPVPAGR